MTALIIILTILLLGIVIVQIGKVTELATKIRGEALVEEQNNKTQGLYLMIFMVVFLVFTVVSAYYYKNYMMGYGPHTAASAHGPSLDNLFNVTLFFTGIIFVLTHIALFYFSWKYKATKGRRAVHWSHNDMLEIVWSVIPALVMTYLVVQGLIAWNTVMADVGPDEEVIEIEATGYQFAWALRYPGPDGVLGSKNYLSIDGSNPLGQLWEDEKNLDDIHANEIVLPVNKKVRVRINSRDVLHNFFLPHFRVKMDAVPGIPTYFVFTPTKTTEEYREELSYYEEYQIPADPDDPDGPEMWEAFNYELACAELCGASHYSMRRLVRIVSEEEYQDWLNSQSSYFMSTIRNTDKDPYKDQLLDIEIRQRRQDFNTKVESAMRNEDASARTFKFEYVEFETGSAALTALSKYELDDLVSVMKKYDSMKIEVSGHTDNTGDADANLTLSQQRAEVVKQFLADNGIGSDRVISAGFGPNSPIDTNDTPEGRQNNRRTEFKILAQ